MTEKKIADLFRVKRRFLRSVHLERDFPDTTALSDYVLTDFARSCLGRMADGLKPRSGQRAWRMTGDYGSGKSSFALVLAHWLAGQGASFPPQIRRSVDFHRFGIPSPHFLPLLITCSRQPLSTSILESMRPVLKQVCASGVKSRLGMSLQRLLDAKEQAADDEVFQMVAEVNRRVVSDSKYRGLLLVLDELGKFLEFAALHPDRQDVFLLQRLAEFASRSKDEPLFIVCILHQGFNAYAEHLDQSAQREWEKVAGRFEEIVFNQPVEQITEVIASSINVRFQEIPSAQFHGLRQAMSQTLALGWFGSAPASSLEHSAGRLYPLHPTVLPALIRIFRRFGQNERSLFSFLLSNEPFGLQTFSEKRVSEKELYRLSDFYDYVRSSFGHRLAVQSYRSHWNLIDSVVASFATEDELHIKILKTVGILNLLDDGDLLPTEESVLCALAGMDHGDQKRIRAALTKLHKGKRILYDRGRARGLCLWPHTCVDLEKAYGDASRAIDAPRRVADCIKDFLETRPIVARRHYIETGNLRYYDVRYCSVTELPKLFEEEAIEADGRIIVPLCETPTERKAALDFVQGPQVAERQDWLIAVPQPLNNLAGLMQEFRRWEWVSSNTGELNADKYAREEVSRQKAAARLQLEKRIQSFIGWKQLSGQSALEWFHRGRPLVIKNGRQVLEILSRVVGEIYPLAPKIHNELVNRRSLSTAAAAARMRLIERMVTHAKLPCLGMDLDKTPPEKSMYLSVLKLTGLHQQHGDSWSVCEPDPGHDPCNVLPALQRMLEIVVEVPDSRVNVAGLFGELRKPPFGVRNGIIPLLLATFAITHEENIAFYKDGTFLRELTGESMLVLTKSPERFDIQYCKISGVRAEIFVRLLALLEVKPAADRNIELLDVVKELCVFVARLPGYVLNTHKLSPSALAVRDVILNAQDPAKLLFSDLPKACSCDPIGGEASANKLVQLFVQRVKAALDELRASWPELQERLRKQLREAFDLVNSFHQSRMMLAARAQRILLTITDPKLRAFCLRLMDDKLPESEWLESLGSFLALKPPSKWHDAEEGVFNSELAQTAARFRHVESIVFGLGKSSGNAIGIRLAITKADGAEHVQVVHFTPDEERQLREMEAQFTVLLANGGRLGLAAASRAIWAKLDKGDKTRNE